MGWLRRTFRVPAGWKGKRLILHFEAVAGECQIQVNGAKVGEHFESYIPFELDVTAQVKPGMDNELLIGIRHHRLFDKTDARYPKFRMPYPNGSNTDPLVGIWQDVSLLAVDPVHVTNTFVKPLVAQDRLEVAVTLANNSSVAQTVSVGGSVAPW
ncbi:MAG: beta-galactosidase, partial [Alphaproteobacteria bacterium]